MYGWFVRFWHPSVSLMLLMSEGLRNFCCRVLTTLLKNDLIPDPFYGLNNLEVPDIGEVGREYYTFWFCNKFKLPSVVSLML